MPGLAVDLSAGLRPDIQGFVIQKIKPNIFQNMQRSLMDLLDLLGSDDLQRRQRITKLPERNSQHGQIGLRPEAVCSTSAFPHQVIPVMAANTNPEIARPGPRHRADWLA